jgi:predicted XRE-type DNA-binding protein
MNVPKNITVKDFLTQAIENSKLKQTEIAEAVGYDKPNFITMLKQGKTKLPVNKVPAFAKILGIDEL